MINKRNTEGYVLAYLLIVITVMGVIAATLMTSTLQVVQAQEKSLVYMKDKYEAMGKIEKLMADLSSLTFTKDPFATNPGEAETTVLTDFSNKIIGYKQENSLIPTTGIPDTENKSVTFTVTSVGGSVKVVAQITMKPEYTLPETTHDEDNNLDTTDDQTTTYGYSVTGVKSTTIDSYSITGGAAG